MALVLFSAGCTSQSSSRSPYRSAYYGFSPRRSGAATYRVAPGDTVYHIAHNYGISTESLMAANDIDDPYNLRIGQVLTIPDSGLDNTPMPPATASAFGFPDPWSVPRADRHFAWPVTSGALSSPFGMRNGAMHDGVDITAPAGTPVHAADDGNVIFAGHLHGYGNVVIIQHGGGYVTVYGHNQRNLVPDGASVKRGQQVAEIGASGRASGPNLHFEVRFNNQAENPLAYLPEPNRSNGITLPATAAPSMVSRQ
jgi:murein DD-endopeptidase MepM/ murein hydrolase activator NlpD